MTHRPFLPGPLRGALFGVALALSLTACKSGEERADEYYQSALTLLEQGDVDRAVVQLRNVFSHQGDHYDARRVLAETLTRQGNIQEAYSQYLRLAEQYPDDARTRIVLSELAFRATNWDEVARHGDMAASLAPDDPRVVALAAARGYRDAVMAKDEGARARLLAEVETLLAAQPDNPVLLTVAVDGRAQSGDLGATGPLLDRLLTVDPGNQRVALQKLALLVEQGDPAAIEAHLKDSIARFPDDIESKARLLAFYLQSDRIDDAEAFLRGLVDAAPDDSDTARIDLVRFLEEHRGPEAARAELDRIIAAGGDPLTFGVLRGGFDYNAGRQAEGIAALETVLAGVTEPTPRSRDVQVALARMQIGTGQTDAAKALIETVLAADPAHPEALKLKAGWDIEADRTDAAITALRGVVDQRPEDVEAMTLLAQAHSRAGEADLARDMLGQAAERSGNAPEPTIRYARVLLQEGRFRPAEDALLAALKLASDNVGLLAALGESYLGQSDRDRAQGVVTRLREIGTPAALQAADGLEVRDVAASEGLDAAIARLEAMAGTEGAATATQLQLIRARLASGDGPGAIATAEALAATDPDDPALQGVLGAALMATGSLDRAESIYEDLIARDPADAGAHLALVRIATMRGDEAASESALAAGLAAAPDNPDLLWAEAGLRERAGDIDAAIAIYERLYAQNTGSVVIANNLASLLATHRFSDPAAVERAGAIARRLRDVPVPAFQDTFGWVRHLQGASEEALPALQAAAAGLPDDPVVQVHLGLVQAALGLTEEARTTLTAALALPPTPAASAALERAKIALDGLDAAAAAPAPATAGN